MSALLVYALIPAGTESFVGRMRFGTTNDAGRPLEAIHATQYELLSLRQVDGRPGEEDVLEQRLIQVLADRATRTGIVLPAIVTTSEMPGWSKMALPREVVRNLRRAGGLV
jgi:hypothetical protein